MKDIRSKAAAAYSLHCLLGMTKILCTQRSEVQLPDGNLLPAVVGQVFRGRIKWKTACMLFNKPGFPFIVSGVWPQD